MREKLKKEPGEGTVWMLIVIAFLILSGTLVIVFYHDKSKPQSPNALVAAGFTQMFTVKEWAPGIPGPQPLMYHPAGIQQPVWRQIPAMPGQTAVSQPAGNSGTNGLVFQKIVR